ERGDVGGFEQVQLCLQVGCTVDLRRQLDVVRQGADEAGKELVVHGWVRIRRLVRSAAGRDDPESVIARGSRRELEFRQEGAQLALAPLEGSRSMVADVAHLVYRGRLQVSAPGSRRRHLATVSTWLP